MNPQIILNPFQANTIRIIFNTVAVFALELDYNIKIQDNQLVFHLWADARNFFYCINANGYITNVQEFHDNQYFPMENFINLSEHDILNITDLAIFNNANPN